MHVRMYGARFLQRSHACSPAPQVLAVALRAVLEASVDYSLGSEGCLWRFLDGSVCAYVPSRRFLVVDAKDATCDRRTVRVVL
eukprot:CAMPEP_0206053626 /NCGR_PEP_ID=MMETSP1466-20131121/36241_1 /ASSEMBLY_ACC=CAM_ASM_001126 /TAXON_ID=44452 /ORGANISM="Pavlova gyrans, Strain CCMP608" /LENGTH=82 /DNA_ID=CAMNT_0053428805 /DNA_START=269 /DNA_END=517 /DNA_ORIENTATION=-